MKATADLLEHYYLPGELARQVENFVTHYNTRRYHESLNNLTPECVFTGQHGALLTQRDKIRRGTIALRTKLHAQHRAASPITSGARMTPSLFTPAV